jgi:hypothetical protein
VLVGAGLLAAGTARREPSVIFVATGHFCAVVLLVLVELVAGRKR